MPHYLDVSVRHIQRWLVRAPHLRGRRGASGLLSQATGSLDVDLAGLGAELNPEVGQVDGVISVLIHAPRRIADVEDRLLDLLRRAAPAAVLTATRREGATYTEAFSNPIRTEHRPPLVPEWPLAKHCDWCGAWPASTEIHDSDGRKQVCRDCDERDRASGRNAVPDWVPPSEVRFLEALRQQGAGGEYGPLADNFAALAALGPLPDDRTHLATVFADGNSIGAFIDRLRGSRSSLLKEAPRKIDNATWASLLAAVRAVGPGDDPPHPPRIVPHLVGGDDLLVTVPAHTVWLFVRTFLTDFADQMQVAFPDMSEAPTASAGIVVHHLTYPFKDVVELAEELLHADAKHQHKGEVAALAWQSITHDGPAPLPQRRRSIRIEELAASWEALAGLAGVPASQRRQLARLCRETAPARLPAELDRQLARVRVGSVPLVDRVRPFLPGSHSDPPIDLPDALGITRWWWTP